MRRLAALAVSAGLASCASAPATQHATPSCEPTRLAIAFLSEGDVAAKAAVEQSAVTLTALFASPAFAQACRASSMNRTEGRSVAAVCAHLACSGPQTLRVGLFYDPTMATVAFEKRGAVFLNTAKDKAGTPPNLAHEFAHVLGYSHRSFGGWRRASSVPYVMGRLAGGERHAEAPDNGVK